MNTNRIRKMKPVALVLAAAIGLSACVTDGSGHKQGMGTLLGAGLGALAGANIGKGKGQLVAVGIGTLLGAGIGNHIGRSLDRADRLHAARATNTALETMPTGSSINWSNPDSGHYGTVTPTQTYQAQDGRYCREFQHRVFVGGREVDAYGTACRQPDGSWQIVSTQ